ncbi:MAG: glycosyltransferase [Chloroflexota bacterium]|nr:glycosyltransferase [Chloroflexota bacterium]MDE2948610.1 glycosyltransferase [Chloroflexota bacterium]
MPRRVLFIAALHHPDELVQERARAPAGEKPLFPRSMGQHYWERAFRAAGYELDVFWRNLPGYGRRDISRLSTAVYRHRWTPGRVAVALQRRISPRLQPDLRRRNELLLAQAARFQPDLIWLSGDNREIFPDTLARLKREHKCKIIYVTGVSPIVFSQPIERAAARLYDLVLVNDYYHGVQWLELGARKMECLPYAAIDPAVHRPQPITRVPEEYLCDVGFVGTLLPNNLYSERVAALESLRDFDLGIWSMHEAPPSLRRFQRGSALGLSMMQVLSSVKISINTHGDFMRYGGNMRLFESAALGAFQIVDDRPGVHEWFRDGEHLVTYSDHDDLREKARYYLAHDEERLRIVDAARAHVLAAHRYDQRLARVEGLLREV